MSVDVVAASVEHGQSRLCLGGRRFREALVLEQVLLGVHAVPACLPLQVREDGDEYIGAVGKRGLRSKMLAPG